MRTDYHIKPVRPYAERNKQTFHFRVVTFPESLLKGISIRATKKRYALAEAKIYAEALAMGRPFIVERVRHAKRKQQA